MTVTPCYICGAYINNTNDLCFRCGCSQVTQIVHASIAEVQRIARTIVAYDTNEIMEWAKLYRNKHKEKQ